MYILKSCGGERQIILQVQSLMNSADDTLPKEVALAKLHPLRAGCVQPSGQRRHPPTQGTGSFEYQ